MRDIRIRNTRAEIKERPERYSDDPEQRTGRKENPERLLADLRQRAGPSALNVR